MSRTFAVSDLHGRYDLWEQHIFKGEDYKEGAIWD